MAAGGFKEFVAGETLDEDEINDFLMQGVLVFADAAARDAAITAPVEGQFTFRTDDDVLEFFDGTDFVELSTGGKLFEHLCIGGGGGGGRGNGGGGGAGGYHSSVAGENSGGSVTAYNSVFLVDGNEFLVTVGAGGAGRSGTNGDGFNGTFSNFYQIEATGGGGGGSTNTNGLAGGSGGGAGASGSLSLSGGNPRTRQGFVGGGFILGTHGGPAGGGGAGQAGFPNLSPIFADGGDGLESSITGSATFRAGGGGGGSTTGAVGGLGGGGDGSNVTGENGDPNTGGGGGGMFGSAGAGGNGGSGVVILKYPDSVTLTVGAGLTSSTATSGGFKVTTFTAGTDTVTVSI